MLGLRDFDERSLRRVAARVLGGASVDDGMDEPPMGRGATDLTATPEPTAPPAPPTERAIPAATPGPAAKVAPPVAALPMPQLGSSYDWVSPLDNEPAQLAHLLRRATFGSGAAELDRAIAEGYARTVDRLVDTPPAAPPALAGADAASPATALRLGDVQRWWVDWMIASPTPFAEAMTLFWHDHFPSDYRKVGLKPPSMYWQNLTWRSMALGDLRSMLLSVTADPAMLRYLDLGQSTGLNPNENYARELMEIFTMGPGNYTEDDVKAAAKALAGWREPRDGTHVGVVDRTRAYRGTVTYLGKTGTFDTEAVIDRILAQDATAPFVVRDVLTTFATPRPANSWVARLASRFRANGYRVTDLMRDVFNSPEFTSPEAYRALIKSPTDFMVHSAKALGDPTLSRAIVAAGFGMGQNLFDPPSVGGWPKNESWVSSSTMLQRANFASAAVAAVRTPPSAADAHLRHLDGVLSAQTVQQLRTARDDRARWWTVLASPEFQLK